MMFFFILSHFNKSYNPKLYQQQTSFESGKQLSKFWAFIYNLQQKGMTLKHTKMLSIVLYIDWRHFQWYAFFSKSIVKLRTLVTFYLENFHRFSWCDFHRIFRFRAPEVYMKMSVSLVKVLKCSFTSEQLSIKPVKPSSTSERVLTQIEGRGERVKMKRKEKGRDSI